MQIIFEWFFIHLILGEKNQQYRISHWKLTRKFLKFRNNWHVKNDSYVYQYIITTEYTKNIKRL